MLFGRFESKDFITTSKIIHSENISNDHWKPQVHTGGFPSCFQAIHASKQPNFWTFSTWKVSNGRLNTIAKLRLNCGDSTSRKIAVLLEEFI